MGLKVLPSHIIYEASSMSREKGTEELKNYKKQLLKL
jgi:NAD(P)H dehydrogenase (quinone)